MWDRVINTEVNSAVPAILPKLVDYIGRNANFVLVVGQLCKLRWSLTHIATRAFVLLGSTDKPGVFVMTFRS
jgi:hypothetical protein